jgi:CheY-like chemotaxis protein
MRKIMLVIDDYSEMIGLESTLRRLGFDVLSVAKDVLVNDALLGFFPEILIATYKGRNVDGVKIAMKLKKNPIQPMVALVHSGSAPLLNGEERRSVDVFLESPLRARHLIESIARLAKMPAEPLLEKYEKVTNADLSTGDGLLIVGNRTEKAEPTQPTKSPEWDPQKTPGTSVHARSARSDRYDKFLETHDEPVDKVMPHEVAQKAMRDLKKAAQKEKEALDKIDEEKKAFVKAMFDKPKR